MTFKKSVKLVLAILLASVIVVSAASFLTLYDPIAKVETSVQKGYNFLVNDLWNSSVGGYKEIPDQSQLGNSVLAYYYVWYGDPTHAPTWPNSSSYEPSLGGYNSSNPAVITQHLSWIKQAGLNGVLVSYWDKRLGANSPFEDNATTTLFQTARQPVYSGIKIGLMMERVVWNVTTKWQVNMNFSDPLYQKALVQDLDSIVKDYYLPYPDVYLSFGDKPVIALYAFLDKAHETDDSTYAQFFAGVKARVLNDTGVEVSLWSLNTVDPAGNPTTFDVTAVYNPLEQRRNSIDNQQSPWAVQSPIYTSQSGVRVASVIPGYNDTVVRASDHNPVYDRANGSFYSQQWAQALGFDSQVVLVTSFNEWHESTSIEPSLQWGNQYLDRTRDFVQQLPLRTSDNLLARQFHTIYFPDNIRMQQINELLADRSAPTDTTNRWLPLSMDPCAFRPYNASDYVDQLALDGIYYARCGQVTQAQQLFDALSSSKFYDPQTGLLNDTATPVEGHTYYKIALALILADKLGKDDWASRFAGTLFSLQRPDGSWLTDDKTGPSVWPNTETSMLILIGLRGYQQLHMTVVFNPWITVLFTSDAVVAATVLITIKMYHRRRKNLQP